jgi:hypothetical protein
MGNVFIGGTVQAATLCTRRPQRRTERLTRRTMK